MKTKVFCIAVCCLFLFAAIGQAQQEQFTQEELTQMQVEVAEEQLMRAMMTGIFRQFWDGRGANIITIAALQDSDFRTVWGVSDEQMEQIEEQMTTAMESMQEQIVESLGIRELMEEMETLSSDREDYAEARQRIEAELMQKTSGHMEEIGETIASLVVNTLADAMDDVLTSEQQQTIGESLLANLAELPIMSPSVFEALGLTDAQRQQMEWIKRELEPEFEETLEKWMDGSLAAMRKSMDDPEFKRIGEEMQALSRAFSTQFRTRMFDVLTDEQWFRLQELIDNPPEHALILRKLLREHLDTGEETAQTTEAEDGRWMPGPGSWQPGDAIPEAYRIERNERRRFPREERE